MKLVVEIPPHFAETFEEAEAFVRSALRNEAIRRHGSADVPGMYADDFNDLTEICLLTGDDT